ncbi:MAG: SbcC/MukB-like Walker B domain-containing protein [Edaphobacter sp.]
MKKLQRLVLVQFFLYEAEELDINGHVAFLGSNGSGKTSLLDAIQIAMLGGHGNYLAFNTQSVGSTGGGKRNPRTIKDYCLGVVDDTGENGGVLDRKRDRSITYVTLVFGDEKTREQVSLGICIRADAAEPAHEVLGLYVLPGVGLTLSDHVEQANGDEVPLLWNDFVAAVRSRSNGTDRTPYFTTQPTKYIQEMIHALQPKAKSIDVREYLKVFNKSILLRNIESVDNFVRDYIVEPQSIDRRRAKSQIEHFKQLSLLLEQVRKQIADLAEISAAYRDVERYTVRSSSIKALAAMFAHDELADSLDTLETEIRSTFQSRRSRKRAAKEIAARLNLASEARDAARDAWTSKPGADSINAYGFTKTSAQRSLDSTRQRVERDLSLIAGVVDQLLRLNALPLHQERLRDLDRSLAQFAGQLKQGAVAEIDSAISDTINFLLSERDSYEALLAAAREKHETAAKRLSTVIALNKNAERGGAPISESVALIIARLNESGIVAEPVCNIVEVKDRSWQPAIEAFLKSNREALVIADGREREAIRMIRNMPERDNPFAARVIQPYHLKDHRWNERDGTLVGNLLTSENKIALAYLRSVLGTMRCVNTEEELERNPRALTIDGMLSANFSTTRLRLYPTEKLLFGKRLTQAEQKEFQTQLTSALNEVQVAKAEKDAAESAISRIAKMGDLEAIRARVANDVEQAATELKAIRDVEALIRNVNTDEIGPLKKIFDEKQSLLEEIQQEQRGNAGTIATIEANLRISIETRSKLQRKCAEAGHAVDVLIANNKDVDMAVIERYRSEIEAAPAAGGYQEYAAACQRRIERADHDAEDARGKAIQMLTRYLDRHGVVLEDELNDWRLAKTWVESEYERLDGTELVKRAEDVRSARFAAEEAFRNDIAVRIRESIEQMRTTISDINKALSLSPPFSNGERYRFVLAPAEAHKPIYDYIMNVGKGSERDLFTLGNTAHSEIMRLLEDPGQEAKGPVNPLDDFRVLFTFDLMIDREGKKSLPLSRRLGVGSNGEHRTPFYVIAGAAMAAAYRIDASKHTGAGLILLDEAFHGMDQQNALAAARFLDSIGLQMIMAAPEADHSKIAPSLDTIFEINRFDKELFVERTIIKEPAKVLLTSDMPSEHPELLFEMVEKIKATTA